MMHNDLQLPLSKAVGHSYKCSIKIQQPHTDCWIKINKFYII